MDSNPRQLSKSIEGILLLSSLCAFALSQVGCAGYQGGPQSLYRSDVRSVHVAMFDSNSYRRFLGQRMTEAVIKQIEVTTPYLISDPQFADSIVQGKIIRETKRSAGDNRFDEPRDVQVACRVEVTWTDRSGTPLMQKQLLRIDNDENFIPEAGQSLTTAQQKLIEKVAREIVGQMEMPW